MHINEVDSLYMINAKQPKKSLINPVMSWLTIFDRDNCTVMILWHHLLI